MFLVKMCNTMTSKGNHGVDKCEYEDECYRNSNYYPTNLDKYSGPQDDNVVE